MSCFNPMRAWKIHNSDGTTQISFKRPKSKEISEELKLPCSRCIGCLLDKANSIATRCWCESKSWSNNCFITLTYNNNCLPKNGLLCKKDLQDFLKRLRYYHKGIESWNNPRTGKEEFPIRYLACGEYGPGENSTHRPHYHIIIFNWRPKNLKFYKFNKYGDIIWTCKELYNKSGKKNKGIWGKGFVTVEDFNYQTSCYVARYTQKKLFKNVPKEIQKKCALQPEFTEWSRNGGIGLKYWQEHKNEILKRMGILIKIKDKVKNKQIPQYFERQYKKENESDYLKYQEKKIKLGKENWEKIMAKTSKPEYAYRQQLEQNLIEKTKILTRTNFV